MRIIQFEPWHLDVLELQEEQGVFLPFIVNNQYREALKNNMSYTLYDEQNLNTLCCAGLLDVGFGRAEAWSLISKDAGHYMTRITKEVILTLNKSNFQRIEIHVKKGFKAAERWAEFLGFVREGEMKKYIDGESYYLYARYK